MLNYLLEYSKERIESALEQIKALEQCEFPYSHAEEALKCIKETFEVIRDNLNEQNENSNELLVERECATSLKTIVLLISKLGFILRSTNIRNAFEVFTPLVYISRRALEPDKEINTSITKLVLSSEWQYSPITHQQIQGLPGFVLIGLPAHESSNPLLVPLTGHELGHAIWEKNSIKGEFRPLIEKKFSLYIDTHWKDFPSEIKDLYDVRDDHATESKRTDTLLVVPIKDKAITFALNQIKETFCDFIGLSIYGRAYLQAFAYLCIPQLPGCRSPKYPNTLKRVNNLINAAAEYDYRVIDKYATLFEDRQEPKLFEMDKFSLSIADTIFDEIVPVVIDKVKSLIDSSKIQKPNNENIQEIYERYKNHAVPFEKCDNLADILNAAWMAYDDSDLWNTEPLKGNKNNILKELVLKNIEILGINQVLNGFVL